MHSCGSHYRPRSLLDSLNAAPRIYAAGGYNKICTSLWRGKDTDARAHTCVSVCVCHASKVPYASVRELGDCHSDEEEQPLCRTPPVTKSWIEEKTRSARSARHSKRSFLKIQPPSSDFDSPGRSSVTHNRHVFRR